MIRKSSLAVFIFSACIVFFISTCKKDQGKVNNGYPDDINKILTVKCAITGCHTANSKDACAGLALETWDELFTGSRNGAVCIPYSHGYSTLFLFTNTDASQGPINIPNMPLNHTPLSKDEMKTLTTWIDAGAPDANGKIMWADNPNRKKFYVTNQGCDVVTVIDAATLLQMRYISVGASLQIESPHMVKISPDGKYWYVCFSTGGTVLEKHNTSDDSYVAQATLPQSGGFWNTVAISNDSKNAYVVDWESSPAATVAPVNLTTMVALSPWRGLFVWPHGSSINPKGDTVYIAANYGNCIYKVPVGSPQNDILISVDPLNGPMESDPHVEPHDIAWSPDSSMYFVTCDSAAYVSVLRRSDDKIIATIPTGLYPQEIAVSQNAATPYLFVSCMYDPGATRGSVTVINYQTLQQITNIKSINIAEPHGIGVDDANGLVYVANRNITTLVLPHHSTSCKGTDGFVSFIDLKTFAVLPFKREVAVDPYSIAIRK